jgi:multidrug efflux pump subunit AcrA (membrane-fusion protein)
VTSVRCFPPARVALARDASRNLTRHGGQPRRIARNRLTPGLFARVRIPISPRHPALLISESAIRTDQGQKYVLVVDKEEIAQYRKVHLGAVVDDKRIVTDGLSLEDEVVIDGIARVRPGMKVAPEAAQRSAANGSGPKNL